MGIATGTLRRRGIIIIVVPVPVGGVVVVVEEEGLKCWIHAVGVFLFID